VIVATAGHIDHGKTLLVRALTGVDTDRLPEERRRGMTIDLGFAFRDLPTGGRLAFVDVPGHERFVRNMAAGVAGIDYALLVVAADDGPMPQTREHLGILELMGVRAGAVALTKRDRVAPERLAEAAAETARLLAGSGLAGAPVFALSALTGEGVPALAAHLAEAGATLPARARGEGFRLAVDRRFIVDGAGLVVTGTAFAGTVRVGDRLLLTPSGLEARVRGLHAQNREAATAGAGERCALNLAGPGLGLDAVERGDWVAAPELHAPTRRIDAWLTVLAGEARPLQHDMPVHLHLGAADVTGRLAVLDGRAIPPGGEGPVQLVLDRRIAALAGDRFVLRDQSATRTLAGGRVLDPWGAERGRARAERLARLQAMRGETPAAVLAELLRLAGEGVEVGRFARAHNLSAAAAATLAEAADAVLLGPPQARLALARPFHADALAAVPAALDAAHAERPDSFGLDEAALRRRAAPALPADAFAAVVAECVRAGAAVRRGVTLARPGHKARPTPAEAALWQRVGPLLAEAGLRPPIVREIAAALDLAPEAADAFLHRAAALGLVVKVARNRFFPPAALLELAQLAGRLAAAAPDGRFQAAAYRDASGIGRNLTIELLEFFDRTGLTRRDGEGRAMRRPPEDCFAAEPGL